MTSDNEPTWEELTVPENEPDWDELDEPLEDNNMFQAGPDPYDERLGFYTKEFAEGMREGQPEIYYAWSWTPDGPAEE